MHTPCGMRIEGLAVRSSLDDYLVLFIRDFALINGYTYSYAQSGSIRYLMCNLSENLLQNEDKSLDTLQ